MCSVEDEISPFFWGSFGGGGAGEEEQIEHSATVSVAAIREHEVAVKVRDSSARLVRV